MLTRLFSAFMAWPEPTAPVRKHGGAHGGEHRHRLVDRFFIAAHHDGELGRFRRRGTPPETGASISVPPSAATCSARRCVTDGTPESSRS